MNNVEWIEIKARTVDLAVEVAMAELGVEDPDQLAVEVISEPVKGFLGMGGQDAVVRVKKRSRRRRGGKRKGRAKSESARKDSSGTDRPRRKTPSAKNRSSQASEGPAEPKDYKGKHEKREKTVSDDRPVLTLDQQAEIVGEFLEGLLDAYGLEGTVTTDIDEDVILADVSGEQTEALVGVRGSVRSAIHELSRTVLQRYGQDTARLRLDIAGYAERRRQALSIYAEQLIEQLETEGGEIMLEPMSPADRKVIHDVAAARQGVSSYSEGEPPKRYVVLSVDAATEEE